MTESTGRSLQRYVSQMEAEDLALTCRLKDNRKLLILTRRSAYNGGHEESMLLIRDEHDEVILAVAITAALRYEFVGGGVFAVHPSGKVGDELFFHTASLHEMWATVTILEETLASIKMENVVSADGHTEWLPTYFPNGFIHSSEYVWEARENVRDLFGPPRVPTPPAGAHPHSPSYRKPDLEELKEAIACFIQAAPDPDDISESDVIEHLKNKFGSSIVGKYGYTKAAIQKWTYTFYGQLEKPSQIDDRLFLGSEFNAANLNELRGLGVTHILNVTSEVDRFFPKEFEYHQVHVLDVPSVNLMPYFGRALSFIESGIAKGGVFVHCQRGVSRSATFVIAHMMRSKSWELAEALKHVKERRRIVKPNTGFIVQLKELEKAFVLGNFVVDQAFERRPVSRLRENHESKAPKTTTRPSSPPKQLRASSDDMRLAEPWRSTIKLMDNIFVVQTTKYSVIDVC